MAQPSSFKEVSVGKYTVLAADVTATYAQITADLTTASGCVLNIMRGNIQVGAPTITFPGGVNADKIRVATNGATYVLTAGDIIHYVIF